MAAVVEFAAALGDLPDRLRVRSLEVDAAWAGWGLSPVIAEALPPFITEVAEEAWGLANSWLVSNTTPA